MKAYIHIIATCSVLMMAGCSQRSREGQSLTEKEVWALLGDALPSTSSNTLFVLTHTNGYWYVYVVHKVRNEGTLAPIAREHSPIIMVRDADGKVEKCPKP